MMGASPPCLPQSIRLVLGWLKIGAASCLLLANSGYASEFKIRVETPDRAAVEVALSMARAHRRQAPADRIVVDLPPGIIRVERPLVIVEADSGLPGAELVLRGDPEGQTVISGGIVLSHAEDARAEYLDLTNLPFPASPQFGADIGYRPNIDAAFSLYQGQHRIRPTRLPIEGYTLRILRKLNGRGRVAIEFEPDELARFLKDTNLWIDGFLSYDWHHELVPVVGVDLTTSSLIVERANDEFDPKSTARVAVLNSSAGSSFPGTATIDLAAGAAHIRTWGTGEDVEIIKAETVLTLDKASSVRLERLAFEKSIGPAVTVRQGSDVIFSDCFIGQTTGSGIMVESGSNVELRRCIVADTARTAAIISGGERSALTRADHRLIDSIVANFGVVYRASPGLSLSGVGILVYGSLVTEGGHWGIQLSGNDHLIEGSEFSNLLRETEDSGVLYMGRDWTQRGNRIVGNYIHDFGWKTSGKLDGHFGIYLDDQFSSVDIRDNIIVGGHYSVLIGGGRDNRVTGNLFVAPTDVGVFVDDRGKAWQQVFGDENSTLMKNFRAVDVNAPIWRQRYPELAAMLTNNPGAPVGNVIEDNVAINAAVARGWRRSASVLLQESRSRKVKAGAADLASPADIMALVSRTAPDFIPPILADRRAALGGLLFFDHAGLGQPR